MVQKWCLNQIITNRHQYFIMSQLMNYSSVGLKISINNALEQACCPLAAAALRRWHEGALVVLNPPYLRDSGDRGVTCLVQTTAPCIWILMYDHAGHGQWHCQGGEHLLAIISLCNQSALSAFLMNMPIMRETWGATQQVVPLHRLHMESHTRPGVFVRGEVWWYF